jgi:hypothetical protein
MNSTRSEESWRDLSIGVVIFIAIAAAFDYMDSERGLASASQALHSLAFGATLAVAAAVGAAVVWFTMRTIRGADRAPDVKDALLWNACLIGAIVTAIRMLR